jgi:hypothetical protein
MLDISRGQQDMVEDSDVRRAADIYIRRYRENAALYATQKGNLHLQRGDPSTAAMWDRICAAIVEQLNAEQR